MLTLFAVPKAFEGEFARIQRNALGSWRAMGRDVEIVLIGDERGVGEEAAQIHAVHQPKVRRDEWGTPLVNDVFRIGAEMAKGEWLAYANADILLPRNLPGLLEELVDFRKPMLVVGQRWDLDWEETIEFADPGWEEKIIEAVRGRGRLHPPSGIDYFLFRRGVWPEIPPFALGRTMWDNWLVYSARSRGIAVVDATGSLPAVHQNHGYGTLPTDPEWVWRGPQAERNLQLAGGLDHYFTIEDATHRLEGGRIHLALDGEHLRRRREKLWILWPPAVALRAFSSRAGHQVYGLRVRVAKWRGRI
jgi:hypothetical protein